MTTLAEAPSRQSKSIPSSRVGTDVLMIYPKTGIDFGSTVAPPHGMLAIAAPLLKEGYKVKLIDQRVDKNWKQHMTDALDTNPICVTIPSMIGTQLRYALDTAQFIKQYTNGKIPIIWGGPIPTIVPEQTLAHELVDIICVREADITFKEVVGALQSKQSLKGIAGCGYKDGGKLIINPERELLDVETLLPVPWELVNVEDYIHPDMYLKVNRTLDIGETSRGCPFKCGFCSSASLRLRRWRAKSVEKTLEEVTEMVRKYNLNGIWMRDDEFYVNRNRARGICEGFIRENLNIRWYTSGTRVDNFIATPDEQVAIYKQSGAYSCKFGAESGSQRILDLMKKEITPDETMQANLKAKKSGIIPVFGLMMGFPTETFDEIQQTIDMMIRLRKANAAAQFETMTIYTAIPGTPMWDLALNYGMRIPETLEGWINFVFDDYDPEGKRSPWYNAEDRNKLGNISYMSVLANSLENVLDSIQSPFKRKLAKVVYALPRAYFRWRLVNKHYSFDWDLKIVRYLREKIFYRGYFIFK